MRIRIFSDSESASAESDPNTSVEYKELYEGLCDAEWVRYCKKEKEIAFVVDDSYTHAIVLGQAEPELLVDKSRVIGFSLEAKPVWKPHFIQYAKRRIGVYYVGDYDDDDVSLGTEPFVEHFSYVLYSLPTRVIYEKSSYMSLVVYDKRYSLGQHYCNRIADMIVKNNLPIDIYGNPTQNYSDLISSVNMFTIRETYKPTRPYEKYAFSIVIEENTSKHFYSDKPITAMMCHCVPIYYGCFVLNKKLEDNVVRLTGNLSRDMNLIVNVLRNPEQFYKEIDVALVDKEVNLLKNAEYLFPVR